MPSSPPFPEMYTPEPPRKPRGCLFYGCLFATILALVIVALVGLATWATFRAVNRLVEQYADDAPAPIPVVERPAKEVDAIIGRLDGFGEALDAGRPTEPLILSADEINALIGAQEQLRGVVAVDLSGDKLRGKISLPLDRFGFAGKFLNGTATFNARVIDGKPIVTIDSLESKGKPIPDAFLQQFRGINLMENSDPEAKTAKFLGRLDTIAVKDGKLVLTPVPPPKPGADAPAKAEDPAEKPRAAEPKEEEPKAPKR